MLTTAAELESRIWEALGSVEDPELPISVTDLGMIDRVDVSEGRVRITMVPTYSACPAIDVMRQDIQTRVKTLPGVADVSVELSFARPWTMDRMTGRGKERLKQHGMSVPMSRAGPVVCPFCGSTNTTIENPFGPTLCRAIYYCADCKNPIERFKAPRDD
jgi:ring-1,2-phenylacetyl-CoA epoxidase subunit PaaD